MKIKVIAQSELNARLNAHVEWLEDPEDGEQLDLSGYDLTGVDFSYGYLSCAYFWDANLRGANFKWADLTGADFKGADLTGADLGFANLARTRFGDVKLTAANLRSANLSGAIFPGTLITLRWRGLTVIADSTAVLVGCERRDWSELQRVAALPDGEKARSLAAINPLAPKAFAELWPTLNAWHNDVLPNALEKENTQCKN